MGKYNQPIGLKLVQCIFCLMLLCSATNAMAFTPEDGWWWNPQEPGRGFNLEIQNGTIFLATFIYDSDGKAVWYSGSGTLNTDNTATFDVFEFENGQCVQCDFQAADLIGTAETITLRFFTGSTGELDWSNGTVPIQRFNFNLGGNWQQQLMGEWAFVSGTSVLPAYTGDRVIFDGLNPDNSQIVTGHRVGNSNASISVFDVDQSTGPIDGFTRTGLMVTNSTTLRLYALNLSGLNRIDGITVDVPLSAPADSFNQTLIDQGVPFVGFRIK